ncbi:MAG: helix-turn-helix transcriptional regulator [Ktedonobacteraceae bacterium]|nr:helix-turn-helix transcriptional regulator [Ktedonobacteraceae bacterium]
MNNQGMIQAHQGKLVAQYRSYMKMTQHDLADALGVSLRTIQRMEKEAVIEDRERRRFLVALLGIPAAYMGFAEEQQTKDETMLLFNNDPMSFIEDTVTHRWKTHLMGGPLSAARGLERVVKEVEHFAQKVSGKQWHQRAQAQLCMVYQLYGSVLGDMMEYDKALKIYQHAFQVARELNDVELMAAVRVREGIVFMRKEKPRQAISSLNASYQLVNGQGLSRLRGDVLTLLSEAYAKANQPQECWRAIGLAESVLQQPSPLRDRSYRIFNPAIVAAHKGVDALLLHDYDRAIVLFDKSLKIYNPTLTPGRARLLARKAEAYYGKGEVGECSSLALEALSLARSVGASNTITRVKNLHASLEQSRWRKEPDVIHLGIALASSS